MKFSKAWVLLLLINPAYAAMTVDDEPFDSHYSKVEIRKTESGTEEIWLLPESSDTKTQPTKYGMIDTLPEGTLFYHWDKPETIARWNAQKAVEAGEVEFLRHGTGLVGGGVYVSKDLVDSNMYGDAAEVFKTTQPTRIASTTLGLAIQTQIKDPYEFEQRLLALGIEGIGDYNPTKTWVNIFSSKPLSNAHAATWQDVENSHSNLRIEPGPEKRHSLLSCRKKILQARRRVPTQNGMGKNQRADRR